MHLKQEGGKYQVDSCIVSFSGDLTLSITRQVIESLLKKDVAPSESAPPAQATPAVAPASRTKSTDGKVGKDLKERPRSKLAAPKEADDIETSVSRPQSARYPAGLDVCRSNCDPFDRVLDCDFLSKWNQYYVPFLGTRPTVLSDEDQPAALV